MPPLIIWCAICLASMFFFVAVVQSSQDHTDSYRVCSDELQAWKAAHPVSGLLKLAAVDTASSKDVESKPTTTSESDAGPPAYVNYTNRTYGFTIDCPLNFVIKQRDIHAETLLPPRPVAAFAFMNPTMATGALAGIEPPDLELRVYEAGSSPNLEAWLRKTSLLTPDGGSTGLPFRNARISGLKVCVSTMLAPGCSVFILKGHLIYQLSAVSNEGETMIETFSTIPR